MFGRSFFAAGGDDVADRAAARGGRDPRGASTSIPGHVREASYALGKTKAATIRRVLLPAIRPGIGTGAALGMGRIAGDTAIIVILLGATLQLQGADATIGPVGTLRGTGSTLTSYVYVNSPAGEGNAPGEGLRRGVRAADDRHRAQLRRRPDRAREEGARGAGERPPPVRRIVVEREPTVVAPPAPAAPTASAAAPAPPGRAPARARRPARSSSACAPTACRSPTRASRGREGA